MWFSHHRRCRVGFTWPPQAFRAARGLPSDRESCPAMYWPSSEQLQTSAHRDCAAYAICSVTSLNARNHEARLAQG